jgi:hypothetical protein
VERPAASWYEAADGWYKVAEEAPDPASEEEADVVADADEEEAAHDREMAKLNVASRCISPSSHVRRGSMMPPSGPVDTSQTYL